MDDTYTARILDTTQTMENRAHYAFQLLRTTVNNQVAGMTQLAGSAALQYVLNSNDTSSRDTALRLKAEASGLSAALDRVDGEWRHRKSVEEFMRTVPRMLRSTAQFYEEEAGCFSLKVVDSKPESDAYTAGRANALRSHQTGQSFLEVLKTYNGVFKPLQDDIDQKTASA